MKQIGVTFLATYFLLGALILPNGNFMSLTDLPKMYQHCKATEDKDMSLFDFFTDHILNLDCLFDAHENDEQKPHKPFQTTQVENNLSLFCSKTTPQIIHVGIEIISLQKLESTKIPPVFYSNNYLSTLFRPPIS
jgi:hypothetical protein